MHRIFLWLGSVSIFGLFLTGCETDEITYLQSNYVEADNIVEAKAYADALNKDIIVLFTGYEWDPNSEITKKSIDSNKFKDRIKKDFVFVNLDYSKEDRERNKDIIEYAANYGITEVPTVIIADQSGKELNRIVGTQGVEELVVFVNSTVNQNIEPVESSEDFNLGKIEIKTIEDAMAYGDGKNILVEFTGSDWCPPCIKMQEDVFNTKTFRDYDGVVRVYLDSPRKKKLPKEDEEYSNRMRVEYNIRAVPTYIVLDSNGKVLKRMSGYLAGGPNNFIKWLESK